MGGFQRSQYALKRTQFFQRFKRLLIAGGNVFNPPDGLEQSVFGSHARVVESCRDGVRFLHVAVFVLQDDRVATLQHARGTGCKRRCILAQAIAGAARYSIINVWRNIRPEPVATHPLALCDAQSVAPDDLVVFEIHYTDRIGENYFAKHADRHRWLFYPRIRGGEALLIQQWDSAGTLARTEGTRGDGGAPDDAPCTFSFHSAFEDPASPPDAPDRCSIEVRCMVLYD